MDTDTGTDMDTGRRRDLPGAGEWVSEPGRGWQVEVAVEVEVEVGRVRGVEVVTVPVRSTWC